MKEKLIDVFMHLDRHIQNRDEYGICYTSDFAEAIETVVAMLKSQDANGVTFATGNNVGGKFAKDTNVLTNADRIRAMTDEELCEFLGEYKFCDICEEGCDACTYSGDCDKRLLDWLQNPVGGE